VYSSHLQAQLPAAVAQSARRGLPLADATTPSALHSHPDEVIAPVVTTYADVLHAVFLSAVPVALVAFVLALFLPQVPLRDVARAGASDLGDGFGMAETADSDRALQTQLSRLIGREGRRALPAIRVASGTRLDGAQTWCVAQVLLRERRGTPTDLDSIAMGTRVPASVLLPAFQQTMDAGYLGGDPSGWTPTPAAFVEWDVFTAELKRWLLGQLQAVEASAAVTAELDAALQRLTSAVLHEEVAEGEPREIAVASR
jgi:hypothetical protein